MGSYGAADSASRPFICPHCEKVANALIVGVAVWNGTVDGVPEEPPVEWSLVQCDRCHIASVQVRSDDGLPNGFDDDEPVIVYPEKRRLSYDVPPPLREQWAEACKCFDAKAYTAAVVMVRRLLEATCADQGAAKRTLAASLKDLRERGLINGVLVEWADALRALGNEEAHYTGTSVKREDAEDALAFAEALVDYLYVLHQRFEQYKWRRELGDNGH
jgi:Domain of unknown function (DUF4145)